MLLEAFTCERRDRRNEWKVVCRRYDRDVPHVDGQFREIRLHVRAFPIPPDQSLDSKAMPQVVNSRTSSLGIANVSKLKECMYETADSRAGVST